MIDRGRVCKGRVFDLEDYEAWLATMAEAIFGVSATEFAEGYRKGDYSEHPAAADVASVMPIIEQLRCRPRSEKGFPAGAAE